MSRIINTLAIAAAAGITGYFIYRIILPKLKDIQWPTWQFPDFSQVQQPPSQYGTAPQQQQQQPEEPVEPADSSQPSTNTIPEPITPPTPPASSGGQGMTIGFKTTGQKIALGGNTHENGYRYHVNHKFTNYLMSGLFKIGSSQRLIEMKTDGPNHSGCSQVPRCFWAEPRFDMSGRSSLSMEMPHTPRKDYAISCPSCKSIPGSYAGKWIGYAVAAYGPKGGRVVEQWVDPTGTGTKWQLTLREKIDARWHGAQNRDLPLDGRGLEAEIRMVDSPSGVDMRNGFVYEIVAPGAATSTQFLRFSNPYLYSSFYNRRRL